MHHLKVPYTLLLLIIIPLSSYCQDSNPVGRSEENVLYIRQSKENKTSVFRLVRPDNIGFYFGPSWGYEKNKSSYYPNSNSSFYVDGLDYNKIICYSKSTWTKNDTTWLAGINFNVPSARTSMTFGVKGEYSLGKVISISPELLYINTGGSLTTRRIYFQHVNHDYQGYVNYEEKHKYSYLDFIFPIKFTPTWLRLHPYLAIGPEIGLLLSSKREVNVLELEGPVGVKDSMTKYGLPINSYAEKMAISKIQAGMHLRFGLGYYLSKKWEVQLELRDYIGYTKLYHYTYQLVRNNNYSFTAGLSYHFDGPYLKKMKGTKRYNPHTGLKTPEPYLPQPFRYIVLQIHLGSVATSQTHLNTMKKATGFNFSILASYLKSVNRKWLVEPYMKASFLSYSTMERELYDTTKIVFGQPSYPFGALGVGIDYWKYQERKSRFKPFVGFGISINQILQLYIHHDPVTSSLGTSEDFNFYRIPTTTLKIGAGTFYRLRNSHYLRFMFFANHSLYPTTILKYVYSKNQNIIESGKIKTFNFSLGFSVSYTLFNLNKLKKELKNESMHQ